MSEETKISFQALLAFVVIIVVLYFSLAVIL